MARKGVILTKSQMVELDRSEDEKEAHGEIETEDTVCQVK